MRTVHRLVFLSLLIAPLTTSCLGSGNSVNAYGGQRSLSTSDFGDLDNPTVYGADLVLKLDLPMLAVEGGWLHADDSGDTAGLNNAKLATDEYFVGLRIIPWDWLIQPYGAVGVSYVDSSLDATGVSDSDNVVAYYARIGACMSFGPIRVGLDGRALFGSDVSLDTFESDVDNYQLAAFIGVGF